MQDNEHRKEDRRIAQDIFQGVLDAASDAIISIDDNQRIILFNKQAEEVFGYKAQEVINKPLDVLLPEKFRCEHAEHTHKFALENKSRRRMSERMEVRGLRKSGEEFPAEIAISKYLQDGKYVFTAILRDVTAQKALDDTLKQNAEELLLRNRQLEEFAFIASHDLQEPMRKITVFSDMLASLGESWDQDRSRIFLTRIMNSVDLMRKRLDALLEYSKSSSSDLYLQELNLDEVVAGVVAEMDIAQDSSGGRVDVQPLPVIVGDMFQMQQLFRNLISNAVKYKKKDQPCSVTISSKPGEDGCWEISIVDTGMGFDQKYADRIFKPFQRLDRESPGTGMGLVICQRIVERLGGTIRVQSAIGQGTSFILSLPSGLKIKM